MVHAVMVDYIFYSTKYILVHDKWFVLSIVDYIFYSTKYILIHDKWFVLSWLIILRSPNTYLFMISGKCAYCGGVQPNAWYNIKCFGVDICHS